MEATTTFIDSSKRSLQLILVNSKNDSWTFKTNEIIQCKFEPVTGNNIYKIFRNISRFKLLIRLQSEYTKF